MEKRSRPVSILLYVSESEKTAIEDKMSLLGTDNMSAYLRKMAIDGLIVKLELTELREITSLLRHTSNNINQIAMRANANGRIFKEDLDEIHDALEQVWAAQNALLQKLAALP
jgi:hypothetical protein